MSIQDIEKRLQILEDKESIKDLHRGYIYLLNNKEWECLADCFTGDAIAQIFRHPRCCGRNQIRDYFVNQMSKVNFGKGRDAHFATLPVIEVEENRAKGHWMLYILISDPVTGNALRWTQGRYECKYEKIEGKWKFSLLVWINPWPRQPATLPKLEDLKDLGIEL